MNVLLLSGSPAVQSHTSVLLYCIAQKLQDVGATTRIWDLSITPLPLSQPSWHKDPLSAEAEVVCEFYGAVMNADAIVLGTPLYHGSYSGVLKNALDCLTGNAFENKPVGIVSHGSNIRKSHEPCLHLTTVAMTMQGIPMLTQIGTGKSDYEMQGDRLVITNEEIIQRCSDLAEEVMVWAKRLKQQ